MDVDRICRTCGKVFQIPEHYLRKKGNRGSFCSRKCSAVFGGKSAALRPKDGDANPNWKGGISNDNYHYKKIQQERYPERVAARAAVSYAKRRGNIEIKPCAVCEDTNVVAHHEDYCKPLDVVWLCRKHHLELHSGKIELL